MLKPRMTEKMQGTILLALRIRKQQLEAQIAECRQNCLPRQLSKYSEDRDDVVAAIAMVESCQVGR